MAGEGHAEKIKDFAFVKICRRPGGRKSVDGGVVAGQRHGQAQPPLQSVRKYVIDHLKARLAGIPIDAGDILQKVVAGGAQDDRGFDQILARDGQRQLGAIMFGGKDRRGQVGRQGRQRGISAQAVCCSSSSLKCRKCHRISFLLQLPLSADQSKMPFFQI